MLKHPVNAHLDYILKVHLPSETHIVVAGADDIVINGFIMLLLDLLG